MSAARDGALAYLGALVGATGGVLLTAAWGWRHALGLVAVYAVVAWWHVRRLVQQRASR